MHPEFLPVAGLILLAALAMAATAGFLARKRLAWETWFDMPVGLTAPQAAGTGGPCQVLLGEPGLRHREPCGDSTGQGWLVLLGITNPGYTCIRGRDFGAPLTGAGTGACQAGCC